MKVRIGNYLLEKFDRAEVAAAAMDLKLFMSRIKENNGNSYDDLSIYSHEKIDCIVEIAKYNLSLDVSLKHLLTAQNTLLSYNAKLKNKITNSSIIIPWMVMNTFLSREDRDEFCNIWGERFEDKVEGWMDGLIEDGFSKEDYFNQAVKDYEEILRSNNVNHFSEEVIRDKARIKIESEYAEHKRKEEKYKPPLKEPETLEEFIAILKEEGFEGQNLIDIATSYYNSKQRNKNK